LDSKPEIRAADPVRSCPSSDVIRPPAVIVSHDDENSCSTSYLNCKLDPLHIGKRTFVIRKVGQKRTIGQKDQYKSKRSADHFEKRAKS
jgi:hypothetical protein